MRPSAAQFRAARAMLGWSQSEAARMCHIGVNTLARLESGEREPGERIFQDLVRTFETAGIAFTGDDVVEGVSLRRSPETFSAGGKRSAA